MCGIIGIIRSGATEVSRDELQRMNDTQSHRGPDGQGYFTYRNVGIGHRRLSIIDLESGSQPLASADKKFWITYNGELYNFLILKKELQTAGHTFTTHSDTEVVLHAYMEWGKQCVTKFRGMFAFGIVDIEKEEVFLARDPFGIKPLVYRKENDFFAFSSEIKALKAVKGAPLKGNLSALDLYFTLQYIPAPHTIYKNMYKLPPANYLRVNFSGEIIEQEQYYDLTFDASQNAQNNWIELVENRITESVQAHLISDVPFGVFLSGGIDSTLVALKMAGILNTPLKAFSIGFHEEEFNELRYAETAAKKIGVELITETVTTDTLEILPDLINNHYGEPFGDSSALPTWHVSKLASREVKMVLTGDGGDEMFAGYGSYSSWMNNAPSQILKRQLQKGRYTAIPRFALGSFKHYLTNNRSFNYPKEWLSLMTWGKAERRRLLWREEYLCKVNFDSYPFPEIHDKAKHFDRLSYAQYIDIHTYLPGDILTKVDIASMANSLETRTPLIDVELAKIVTQLPARERRSVVKAQQQGKNILKQILLAVFPHEFVYRQKQGFSIPFNHWFLENKRNADYFADHLIGASSNLELFFNRSYIEQLYLEYNTAHAKLESFQLLWLLFICSIWLNENKEVSFE